MNISFVCLVADVNVFPSLAGDGAARARGVRQ